MKKISIFIFIVSFFLYRPYAMQQNGMLYRGDDPQYLSYATSLAFFEFPSFDKELTDTVQGHPIGAGILAAPFVFSFSLIDRAFGSTISEERNWNNVEQSWTLFGFVFSSIFYFWLSCFFAYKGVRFFYNHKYSLVAITLMILIQGIPLYAYRRPVFSHIYELFLQTLLVYISCWRNSKPMDRQDSFLLVLIVSSIIGMVTLVRYNNILISLFWPIIIWGVEKNKFSLMVNWKKISLTYMILLAPFFLFIGLPYMNGNNSSFLFIVQNLQGVLSSLKIILLSLLDADRWIYVLFGLNWGLFYSAPFILISFFLSFFLKTDYRKALILALIPLSINFIILVITWRTPGSWYGYRYFIFSAIPILLLPMAEIMKRLEIKNGNVIYIPIVILSILPFLSMLCFEGNPEGLTLHTGYKGRWLGAWDNPTYQLEVWKTVIYHPGEFFVVALKGGPVYLIYLLATALGITNLLPGIVMDKYPSFEINILIKSIIVYVSPFVFYFIFDKKIKPFKNDRYLCFSSIVVKRM
ncbi:hypothetical protein C4565_02825 [Candidatus Parcubacteria bacterium]|nr:MAG: hypothetical protein C4565_02825 [Candidatus Parcubacteria bacterium]